MKIKIGGPHSFKVRKFSVLYLGEHGFLCNFFGFAIFVRR